MSLESQHRRHIVTLISTSHSLASFLFKRPFKVTLDKKNRSTFCKLVSVCLCVRVLVSSFISACRAVTWQWRVRQRTCLLVSWLHVACHSACCCCCFNSRHFSSRFIMSILTFYYVLYMHLVNQIYLFIFFLEPKSFCIKPLGQVSGIHVSNSLGPGFRSWSGWPLWQRFSPSSPFPKLILEWQTKLGYENLFHIVYISLLINNPGRLIHLLCGTDKIVS